MLKGKSLKLMCNKQGTAELARIMGLSRRQIQHCIKQEASGTHEWRFWRRNARWNWAKITYGGEL